MNHARSVLVIGGARSGKSRHAEELAEASGRPVIYVATADAYDDEMRARIAAHRERRPAEWGLIDAPLALAEALTRSPVAGGTLLVDCLTLWLSNHLLAGHDCAAETERLVEAVAAATPRLILVTNEVGQGIVPENALARAFRDAQGRLNQRMAAACEAVTLVVAGRFRMGSAAGAAEAGSARRLAIPAPGSQSSSLPPHCPGSRPRLFVRCAHD